MKPILALVTLLVTVHAAGHLDSSSISTNLRSGPESEPESRRLDTERLLFGTLSSKTNEGLGFTSDERLAYAKQFQNWFTRRKEGEIYPADFRAIINSANLTENEEKALALTDDRELWLNGILEGLMDKENQKDVFNIPRASPGETGNVFNFTLSDGSMPFPLNESSFSDLKIDTDSSFSGANPSSGDSKNQRNFTRLDAASFNSSTKGSKKNVSSSSKLSGNGATMSAGVWSVLGGIVAALIV